jgi:hypothetical protein
MTGRLWRMTCIEPRSKRYHRTTAPGFSRKAWIKPKKPSIRTAGWAEIRTRGLPNTKQEFRQSENNVGCVHYWIGYMSYIFLYLRLHNEFILNLLLFYVTVILTVITERNFWILSKKMKYFQQKAARSSSVWPACNVRWTQRYRESSVTIGINFISPFLFWSSSISGYMDYSAKQPKNKQVSPEQKINQKPFIMEIGFLYSVAPVTEYT